MVEDLFSRSRLEPFFSNSLDRKRLGLKFYLFEWFQVWTALVVWISRIDEKVKIAAGDNPVKEQLYSEELLICSCSAEQGEPLSYQAGLYEQASSRTTCCRCWDHHTVGLSKVETSLYCWSQWSSPNLRPNQRPLPFGLCDHFNSFDLGWPINWLRISSGIRFPPLTDNIRLPD